MTVRSATVALLLGLTLTAGAVADARDDYRNGIEALEAGNAGRAEELFRRAVGADPESRKPLIGRDYLPHYYLGKALYTLGDCRGALEAWEEAERQGPVLKIREESAALAAGKAACRDRVHRTEEAAAETLSLIDRATAAATLLEERRSDDLLSDIWSEGSPSLKDRQIEAVRPLFAAREALREAEEALDPQAARESGKQASQALAALEELITFADRRRSELEARRRDLRQSLDQSIKEAQNALESSAELGEEAPGLSSLRSRLSQLVREARSSEDAGAGSLRSQAERIRSLVSALRRASRRPPEELLIAGTAYLEGDYRAVLDVLEGFRPDDDRIAAQLCLLRSASLHGLQRLRLPLPEPPPQPATEEEEQAGASELEQPAPGPADDESAAGETDLAMPDDPALRALLLCPVDDDLEPPGEHFFPPSYHEVFAEYLRLRAERAAAAG